MLKRAFVISVIALMLIFQSSFSAFSASWGDNGAVLSSGARAYHTATLLPNGMVLLAFGRNGSGYFSSAVLYDPATGALNGSPTDLSVKRAGHTATLLNDGTGRVLFVGGYNSDDGYLSSAGLYDGIYGTYNANSSMACSREGHTATLLNNGNVLVAGGYNGDKGYLSSAEVFVTSGGTFSRTDNDMSIARVNHTATLMPDGKVLIAGGSSESGYLFSANMYDPASGNGTFSAINSMACSREGHTATLLPNGKVLVVGGYNSDIGFLASAEVYNPATGNFTEITDRMSDGRAFHTASLLPDGNVLISGGTKESGPIAGTEIYITASETFSDADDMANARAYHTATLLPDGSVFAAGGYDGSSYLDTAASYVPSVESFSASGGSLGTARYGCTTTLLPDGTVLIAGGYGSGYLKSAEIYDPTADTFTPTTGDMNYSRVDHTATLMSSGIVLIIGGSNESGPVATAEVYDYTSGTFATTAEMVAPRYKHTATLTVNGYVLVAGGFNGTSCVTTEGYFPKTNQFSALGPMNTPRFSHTATYMYNYGKVLITGGTTESGALSSAELYDPYTGAFTPTTGSLPYSRFNHTATWLPNNKVLVVGGQAAGSNTAQLYDQSTELFTDTADNTGSDTKYQTATLLPSGKVLIVGGQDRLSGNYLSDVKVYDPSLGAFIATGTLNAARGKHTAVLLPNNKILVVGGRDGSNPLSSAELARFTEYDYAANATMVPTIETLYGSSTFPVNLNNPPTYVITGQRLRGTSEASGGNGSANSPTNYPYVLMIGQDDYFVNNRNVYEHLMTDTSIEVVSTTWAGYHILTIMANGVPSDGRMVSYIPAYTWPPATQGPRVDSVRLNGKTIYPNITNYVPPTPATLEVHFIAEKGIAELTASVGVQTMYFSLEAGSAYNGWWRASEEAALHTAGPFTLRFAYRDTEMFGPPPMPMGQTDYSLRVGGSRGSVQVVGNLYNYPSPFKPASGGTTQIQYTLSADAPIILIIYDITGHEVKRWKLGAGTSGGMAGVNNVTWDGTSLSGKVVGNGMYLYKVISGDKVLGDGRLVVVD